jgi:hypothetical protein
MDRIDRSGRTPVQDVARAAGVLFVLGGILGFVPGVTTNLYDGLEFAGVDGNAELLGLFEVSVLHNIVHGVFGLAGLALGSTWDGARTYLLGGGAVYLALWLLGLVGGADWLPSNTGDNWLHLALGAALLAAGLVTTRDSSAAAT